ncbi:MAG: cobalamin-dependent protein [Candidatus Riflebacteria bacterium]|nr:cobalamin-dependent protein [Candidatus Riflebacteria bacterium]
MARISNPKLLLSSVFKPFAADDGYSTKENPCELFHNQVTRMQGVFSIRSHIRSFGLELMAANINIPTTVLDFPTEQSFIDELHTGKYTHVGISFIVSNFEKARKMCELVRTHAPEATILVGGHGARIPEIKSKLGCDEVCVGEGIRWLRKYFGEDAAKPIVHPAMQVEYYRRLFGLSLPNAKAVIVPGVGCANYCEFCCTSHFFQGYTAFFPKAEDLFEAMCRISDELGTNEFYVMDENFLGDEKRVYTFIELMKKHQRFFVIDIFSTLRDLARYDPLDLVRLGVEFAWIGIESRRQLFSKAMGVDAAALAKRLKDHGVSILASTILFLDHHDEQSLWDDVEYTLSLEPDYVQFMELAPFPGTALYERLLKAGRIIDAPYRYWHGQDRIWFVHPNFSPDQSKKILDDAFRKDFLTLGPGMLRNAETRIRVVETGKSWNDPFLEKRHQIHIDYARQVYPILMTLRDLSPTPFLKEKTERIIRRYENILGRLSPLEKLTGSVLKFSSRLEERRLRSGRISSQPPTCVTRYRQ